MGKVVVLLLALSLIVERITEKILYLVPKKSSRYYAWIITIVLGFVISFGFRFGFISELGLKTGSNLSQGIDYALSGILIACGSEPLHSIVDALSFKRDDLKRRAKGV
uniref:Uncharacterized protein n=1 Tax=candidate division WOR-3 bacterium TaxID=2052148 RepID=A0A7C4TGM1_UNCW3